MDPKSTIDPTETYVLDEDELAELDDVGITGIVEGLTEYVENDESDPSPRYDLDDVDDE